jgi:hypothetical protein
VDEDTDYKYLVRLPMDSVTAENIEKIMAERDRKNAELASLKSTTETQLWLNELAVLRAEYVKLSEKSDSAIPSEKKIKMVKKK